MHISNTLPRGENIVSASKRQITPFGNSIIADNGMCTCDDAIMQAATLITTSPWTPNPTQNIAQRNGSEEGWEGDLWTISPGFSGLLQHPNGQAFIISEILETYRIRTDQRHHLQSETRRTGPALEQAENLSVDKRNKSTMKLGSFDISQRAMINHAHKTCSQSWRLLYMGSRDLEIVVT